MAGPTYTYTADTPQAANPMNVTAPTMRANFQAINELIAVNHVGFNTTNAGMHNLLTMPFQSTIPTNAATDVTMFAQATTDLPNGGLFATFPGSLTSTIQISDVQTGGGIPDGTSGTGWCQFSTSGVIFKWGTATVTTVQSIYGISAGCFYNFNYPTGSAIPVFSTTSGYASVGYLKITPTSSPGNQNFGALTAYGSYKPTYFTVTTIYPTTVSFNWFAIGM